MLRLFDTASGTQRELVLRERGRLQFYACGPTVYGDPHIGHARAILSFDILRRYLEFSGLEVRHVVNITDVDDKIIARANAEGRSVRDVAEECESSWWAASDSLGALRPTDVPHASQYIDQMVAVIAELLRRGVAYTTSDGVYLEVSQVPSYGLLIHQRPEDLRAGARVAISEEKRSPADFALWKLAKENEPFWAAPFGEGRPGWHTECVAMSLGLLGEDFDLHGAGADLIFPHNENERAQTVALGALSARHWMHHGLVESSGVKMSKSLGNVTSLSELLLTTDPRAYRLLVLRSHYRAPLEVRPDTLSDATQALQRFEALARRYPPGSDPTGDSRLRGAVGERTVEDGEEHRQFRAAMDDDLDTPRALASIFSLTRAANLAGDAGDDAEANRLAQTVFCLLAVLGITVASGPVTGHSDDVARLVRGRDEARARRDFARADQIRDELVGRGFVVEDGPSGTTIRPASST